MTLEKAISDLRKGRFVLVYDADGREEETDLVIASEFVAPESIKVMREDGGGLICATVHESIREKLGIPFLADVFYKVGADYPVMRKLIPNDIPYDTKSAFAITINHRKTFTGVSDVDRAFTIKEFALFSKGLLNLNNWEAQQEFGKRFRSPGHVILLNASKELLLTRSGHTELATALLVMANLAPTATICEMMYPNGQARPKKEAIKYAEEHSLTFIEGKEIIEAWRR